MSARVIETVDCIAEGAAWLAARDPRLAAALARVPAVPLRRQPEGFATLAAAIVSQQVSTASAAAILGRLEAAGYLDPVAVAHAGDEALRGCGLSRPKVRYLQALAAAGTDFAALRELPDDEAVSRLVALPGIGRWTAEIYVMFALGRADVIAAGDLALQEAARLLYDLPARPDERALRQLAQPWSPWRGVAARLLWAYYRAEKKREGAL